MNIITPVFVHVSISVVELAFVKKKKDSNYFR